MHSKNIQNKKAQKRICKDRAATTTPESSPTSVRSGRKSQKAPMHVKQASRAEYEQSDFDESFDGPFFQTEKVNSTMWQGYHDVDA